MLTDSEQYSSLTGRATSGVTPGLTSGERRSVGLSAFRVRRVRGGLIATNPESSPRRKRSALMTAVSSGRSTSMAIFHSWCRSCARYR